MFVLHLNKYHQGERAINSTLLSLQLRVAEMLSNFDKLHARKA